MGSTPFDLADVQEEYHLLLLFTPNEQETGYVTQCSLLAETADDLSERDLLLVYVIGEGGRWNDQSLSKEEARRLRERFEVPPEAFVLVLIGKDGTEKRRDQAPVKPEAIVADIDAMPTR